MTVNFEALGDRILENQPRRAWVLMMWVQEKLNQISLLLALVWNDRWISQVASTVLAALKQYYFSAVCSGYRSLTENSLQTETGNP